MPPSWKRPTGRSRRATFARGQERLKTLGYSIADNQFATNIVGDSTKEAIRQVQRLLGVEPPESSTRPPPKF